MPVVLHGVSDVKGYLNVDQMIQGQQDVHLTGHGIRWLLHGRYVLLQ